MKNDARISVKALEQVHCRLLYFTMIIEGSEYGIPQIFQNWSDVTQCTDGLRAGVQSRLDSFPQRTNEQTTQCTSPRDIDAEELTQFTVACQVFCWSVTRSVWEPLNFPNVVKYAVYDCTGATQCTNQDVVWRRRAHRRCSLVCESNIRPHHWSAVGMGVPEFKIWDV